MKKTILRIALIMLLAGGILALTTWGFGARTSLYFDQGFHIAGSNQRSEVEELLSDFRHIDLRLGVTNLNLRHGNDFRIEGHYNSGLVIEQRDDTLFVTSSGFIRQGGRFTINVGRISFGSSGGGSLTITVPSHVELASVSLDVGVGNIHIRDVAIQDVDLTSGVGNIDMDLPGSAERVSWSGTVGVGRIAIDGERYGTGVGGSASHRVEEPEAVIRFDAGVGNVNITFQNP